MTTKPILSAFIALGVLSGCATNVPPTAQASLVAQRVDGRVVPKGIPCDHLVDEKANAVMGCEAYIPQPALAAGAVAEIAALNTRFAAEVSPVVEFDFDKDALTAPTLAILDAQAAWMRRYTQLRFSVYGHTDLVGSGPYNFDLAKRRAEAVVGYLAKSGVGSAQLDALVAYGETRPLIATQNPEQLNRRAVVEVTGYMSVPRPMTAEPVSCAIIKPQLLASYPVCIEVSAPLIVLPPPPPPVDPEDVDEAITVGTGTNTTTTDASITYENGVKTEETNGSAGNGNVTTGVTRTTENGRVTLETRNNGVVTQRATVNEDGTDLRAESLN